MMFPTDRVAAAAEQSRAGPMERDVELAITALKKGSQLLKYGRRGKPKFCPFRLANDESALIWLADKEEKHLKLSHVSRIVPGQRTPIFQRYPRPEKEYQSFSLIYHERSLDVICKDNDEAEVWITGLKALIQRIKKRRDESRSDGIMSGTTSPKGQTQRSSPLSSAFDSADGSQKDEVDPFRLCIPYDSPSKIGLEKELSEVMSYPLPPRAFFLPESSGGSVHSLSSGGSDGIVGRMKGMTVDTFRVSLSSAVSSSSQGSGHDDSDALGDVYMWGEGTGDGILGGGVHRVGDSSLAMDSFVPKPLDSAVILDVQAIACGRRHAALVTRQGEVFTWGEELGGRLGHGIDSNVLHPKLLDGLKNINVELVACGEYHSCAVSLSGDLYLWGNSASSLKLNGYGTEVSQWGPRKVNGSLEGIPVSSVSCGPWHTAVVTSAGQLFTFGDGTFGVLGHGDRKSMSMPREVESLKGLRTIRAACGVWHTAAVVEVMVGSSSTNNCCSGKLFTWGDGDKGRLGHGNIEAKLVPTCVAALGESNFCQVACGHSMTVALTTTGHVYTMGSPVYGQLGSPQASFKAPTRVAGKLTNNFVEELACGAFHVAVLTSKTEVYTCENPTSAPPSTPPSSAIIPSSPSVCLFGFATESAGGALIGSIFGFGSGLVRKKGFKGSLTEAGSHAKTFALLSGVHSLVICFLRRLRGKDDVINAGVAGCCTGLALSFPGTPQALLQNCVTFGAFSFITEGLNKRQTALAAQPFSGNHRAPRSLALPLAVPLPEELNQAFSFFRDSLRKLNHQKSSPWSA